VGELEELAGHAAFEAMDAADPVADGEDGPDLGHVDAARIRPKLR